ncbi:Zinc finger protein 222 [Araneus ventricosus]|uniref:Zinc finger protein 222 n=1 Tax=Araneus ventricosus TaxID=182803 RepID=A0A4Y2PCZ4_ARAVE|nr:Zinc finger protein 222 [Araneus ventricosus]
MNFYYQLPRTRRGNQPSIEINLENQTHIESPEFENQEVQIDFASSSHFAQQSKSISDNFINKNMVRDTLDKGNNSSADLLSKRRNFSTDNVFSQVSASANAAPQESAESSNQQTRSECRDIYCSKGSFLEKHCLDPTSKLVLDHEKCTNMFTNKCELNIDIQNHGVLNPYKCDHCPKEFPCEGQLRKHYVVHMVEKPYKCDHCDYTSKWKHNLTSHIRSHHESQFDSYLSKHEITSKKLFKRWKWARKFIDKLALNIHMQNHGVLNPYKCDQSPYKFPWESQLRQHYVVHSEEKPFKL